MADDMPNPTDIQAALAASNNDPLPTGPGVQSPAQMQAAASQPPVVPMSAGQAVSQGLAPAGTPLQQGPLAPQLAGTGVAPQVNTVNGSAAAGMPAPVPLSADLKKPDLSSAPEPAAGGSLKDTGAIEKKFPEPVAGTPSTNIPQHPAVPERKLTSYEEYQKSMADSQKASLDAVKGQQDALQAQADAQKAQSQAVVASKQDAINKYAQAQHEDMLLRQKAMAQADADDKQSKARAEDIRNMKVESGMAENLGPVGSIIGILAIGANALFSGISHGAIPMFTVDMINKSIDRSVQAQKDQIQAAKDSNAELDKLSEKRFGRKMSELEYLNAVKRDDYNMALAQADNVKEGLQPGVDQGRMDQIKAGLDGQVAKINQDAAGHIYAAGTEEQKLALEKQKVGIEGARIGQGSADRAEREADRKQQMEDNRLNRSATLMQHYTSLGYTPEQAKTIMRNGMGEDVDISGIGAPPPKHTPEEKAAQITREEGRSEWLQAHRDYASSGPTEMTKRNNALQAMAIADAKMSGATRTPAEGALKATRAMYPGTAVGTVLGSDTQVKQRAAQLGIKPEELDPTANKAAALGGVAK